MRERLMYAAGWLLFHTVTHLPGRFWLQEGALFWWALPLIGYYAHTTKEG